MEATSFRRQWLFLLRARGSLCPNAALSASSILGGFAGGNGCEPHSLVGLLDCYNRIITA